MTKRIPSTSSSLAVSSLGGVLDCCSHSSSDSSVDASSSLCFFGSSVVFHDCPGEEIEQSFMDVVTDKLSTRPSSFSPPLLFQFPLTLAVVTILMLPHVPNYRRHNYNVAVADADDGSSSSPSVAYVPIVWWLNLDSVSTASSVTFSVIDCINVGYILDIHQRSIIFENT